MAKEDWGSGGIIFVSFSLWEKGGQGRSLRGWDIEVEDATEGEQAPRTDVGPKEEGQNEASTARRERGTSNGVSARGALRPRATVPRASRLGLGANLFCSSSLPCRDLEVHCRPC